MLSKKEFQKQFKQLSVEQKQYVKQYHEEKLKQALFIDTYKQAEKILLWIHEC